MDYKHLTIDKPEEHIAIVSLNRPEELNSLNTALLDEIIQLTEEFNKDTQTRVVILTGAGKYFSAGVDLTEERQPLNTLGHIRDARRGQACIHRFYQVEQITIAAINGGAYGGGACLAAACDFRIIADDAKAGFPECKLGMNLSWLALPLVVNLIGPTYAKEMVILANNNDADTLLKWGFVNEVVAPSELMGRALAMARSYADMPPIAAQMIKRSINHLSSAINEAVMHMDRDQWLLTAKTEDFAEGINAFFQKRKGEFTGE